MFPDLKSEAEAYVKILAGDEMGLGPMASIGGINVISGKATLSANLLASQVKRHPNYNYKVVDHSETVCKIDFYEHGELSGHSEFTIEDARKAGVANKGVWKSYPKAMLFARALTQGVRWNCPDVTAGSPAYVPEELGESEAVEAEVVEPGPLDELRRVADGIGTPIDVRQRIGEWIHENGDPDPERVDRAVKAMKAGETADLLAGITLDAKPVEA